MNRQRVNELRNEWLNASLTMQWLNNQRMNNWTNEWHSLLITHNEWTNNWTNDRTKIKMINHTLIFHPIFSSLHRLSLALRIQRIICSALSTHVSRRKVFRSLCYDNGRFSPKHGKVRPYGNYRIINPRWPSRLRLRRHWIDSALDRHSNSTRPRNW